MHALQVDNLSSLRLQRGVRSFSSMPTLLPLNSLMLTMCLRDHLFSVGSSCHL